MRAGEGFQTTAGPVESTQSNHQPLTGYAVETIETARRDRGSPHLRGAVVDAGKHVVALDRALEDEPTRSIESPTDPRPIAAPASP